MWEKHTNDNCTTCNLYEQSKKGGRPCRRKIGHPSINEYHTVTNHLQSIAPRSFWPQQSRALVSAIEPSIICPICLDIPDRPIELIPCNVHVCCECICAALEASRSISCPCCYDDHLSDFSTIRPVTPIINDVLKCTMHKCKLCHGNVILKNVIPHLSSNCKRFNDTSINSILSMPTTQPLTPIENRLTSHLVRRSVENGVLEVKRQRKVKALYSQCHL